MASYNSAVPGGAPRPAVYGAPAPLADAAAPAGTFAPGTKIQVGNHKVIIQKYFSEGGFAHVYLVKMPTPIDGTDIAVLKRVAVPDKENLANMRTEVETMKKLKGHRPIVTYYDSHASQLKGGGYEVFLLMEFCNGGGLIDFMNTRLQNRLTEPEILKIFSDVAEGVACMHYLKPPLLHRDLKVENVLISSMGGSKRFKLCDFGSTAPPRPAATTATECRLIEDDVQKHTTMQYRSPEMVDVYRKQPIDEKSDIWALGVLLYKLCYYTTPFEAQGQLAILNASFKFPSFPAFSDKLKKLIASMLKENPKSRPNIYQVLREACLMQGIDVPIKDIYAKRTESEARRHERLPTAEHQFTSPPPIVGAVFSPPAPQQTVIPEVVPMRRGRPSAGPSTHAAKPSPSPMRGASSDPFAALDANSPAGPVDEISSRFPSLDQFSLLHDHGSKFEFDGSSPVSTKPRNLDQRVTEKLADDAFALPPKAKTPVPAPIPQSSAPASGVSLAQKIISNNPELQSASEGAGTVYQPAPSRPTMVSQGTMTSSTPPPRQTDASYAPYPIHRFQGADHHRASSLPRNQDTTNSRPQRPDGGRLQPNPLPRTSSFESRPTHTRHLSASSRPSLEGGRPGSDVIDVVARTKSNSTRQRPSSTYLESNMDFLREKEAAKRPSLDQSRPSFSKETAVAADSDEETNIESNVDFLQTMEAKRRSSSVKKEKRSSLPSLSGTKNLLAGKFGDAFKRFENNTSAPPGPRTPSPLQEMGRRELTPIAGSEATDGRSDDGNVLDDADNLAPEQRRELERRRLSMEERRVANAAAEYRKRLADRDAGAAPRSIGGVSRAASIQHKVKTLLDENQSPASPKKTAEGYGKYTNNSSTSQASHYERQPQSQNPYINSSTTRKPLAPQSVIHPQSAPIGGELSYTKSRSQPMSPAAVSKTGAARPSAPPKPIHLNSTGSRQPLMNSSPPKPTALPSRPLQARPDMSAQEKEDYIADFSKRFPSLSGIEMVETDIVERVDDRGQRSRDV
ncbi:Serine/threonine-protein kinase ppk30 [Phlyctema vagabunda]|uniref:non-specific serine/threonine protein kinase n=1 Tax=Phlyctema vagabunda TaxID=108571 RepID=A0ABR4P8E1_9HELO